MDELDNLAGLAAEADGLAAPPAGDEPAEPVPTGPTPEEQASDMVQAFAGFVTSYAPEAAAVWTPEARAAASGAIAPLMIKYNFSLMAIPPELTAAVVVGPLLYRSATIVRDKLQADRAAAAAKASPVRAPAAAQNYGLPQSNPAPESGESPAVPVHPQMALYKQ